MEVRLAKLPELENNTRKELVDATNQVYSVKLIKHHRCYQNKGLVVILQLTYVLIIGGIQFFANLSCLLVLFM